MKLLLVIELDNTLVGNNRAIAALNQRLEAIRNQIYLVYLFQQPSAGIIVANAQTELLWWYYKTLYPWHFLAHYPGAAGILEGLIYFNILPFPNSWRAMGYAPP